MHDLLHLVMSGVNGNVGRHIMRRVHPHLRAPAAAPVQGNHQQVSAGPSTNTPGGIRGGGGGGKVGRQR